MCSYCKSSNLGTRRVARIFTILHNFMFQSGTVCVPGIECVPYWLSINKEIGPTICIQWLTMHQTRININSTSCWIDDWSSSFKELLQQVWIAKRHCTCDYMVKVVQKQADTKHNMHNLLYMYTFCSHIAIWSHA